MNYRCPLCLKPLDGSQKLARHCKLHPDKGKTFKCYPQQMYSNIFCPVADCRAADEIEDGVMLRHVGCEEENPFWDGTRVSIPGEPGQNLAPVVVDFNTGTDRSIQVQHWLIGALRDVPAGTREMWFPLMLLRATAERDGGERVGRLVELSGAHDAGKTILAVQSMVHLGYSPPGTRHDVRLNNYIYSRRFGSAQERPFRSFVEILHLNSLLRRNSRNIFLPQGTPFGSRNLRVAFIRPAGIRLGAGDGTARGRVRQLLKLARRRGLRFLRDEIGKSFGQLFGADETRRYWYTLAFYDKSGEVDENEDVLTDMLDKVAVVVNAVEIFGGADPPPRTSGESRQPAELRRAGAAPATGAPPPVGEKSIETAVQRIDRAIERKQLCYLLITQLDRVKGRMGEDDWREVQRIADDLGDVGRDRGRLAKAWGRLFPRRPSPSRALVEKWLGPDSKGNSGQLRERLKDVEDIFFVWTNDLPGSRVPAPQPALPHSHGLAKFVCRCLDIEWEQINWGTRP